jgi:PAS domain S-box-containing protein
MAEPKLQLDRDAIRLLDENEQLRTSLESALEENARLGEDNGRLLRRVTVLARELHAASALYRSAAAPPADKPSQEDIDTRQSQTDEELRVAFEELQVLTEELEVANTGLLQTNSELERRVGQRTRELTLANAALSNSEVAFRTLIEGMPQLAWRSSGGGEWTWSSPQWRDYTGQTEKESLGMGWLAALHPDDRPAARKAWEQATASHALEFEARLCGERDQRYRHFRTRAAPVISEDGAVLEWLGTSTDVDDIVQLQQEQSVLVDELQHRTRNLMAVIQAVMVRTIRGSKTLQDFAKCIDDRLQALARAQGMLSRRGAGLRVAFDVLLRTELSAHLELDADGNGPQVSTRGPLGVPLRSSIVQTLALAVHELSTNAVKYGALASPEGHLSIQWELQDIDGKKRRLRVEWKESGVKNMAADDAPPRGGGYGRELIERALPYQLGARTTYALGENGVFCTIEVAVPDEVAEFANG